MRGGQALLKLRILLRHIGMRSQEIAKGQMPANVWRICGEGVGLLGSHAGALSRRKYRRPGMPNSPITS